MKIGGRSFETILDAMARPQHYRALLRMSRRLPTFPRPLFDYLLGTGTYPRTLPVRTPLGTIRPWLFSHHDLLTVNEIFCREDYACGAPLRTAVDLGANIGLASLWFLTRDRQARVYAFEPLPRNLERLAVNTAPFADRLTVNPVAVGLADGPVTFGWEETGRYGGIGLALKDRITVDCVEINATLRAILAERGVIDVLKVDVEGLEIDLLRALAPDVRSRVRLIYAESDRRPDRMPGYRWSARAGGGGMHHLTLRPDGPA
jgi:FkbM family methyltransferase